MSIIRQVFLGRQQRALFALVSAIVVLSLLTSIAAAAGELTGTFAGIDTAHAQSVTFTNPRNGRPLTDIAGALLLQLDRNAPRDGLGPRVQVFCIELFVIVGRPGSIDTYVSDGPINNPPSTVAGGNYIRYLLANYPASTITTQAEGAARQLAIWHFTDNLDLTTITDAAIRARALALAAEAQTFININGPLPTNSGTVSIAITPANTTVPQGQAVAYTVSVTPAGAAATVTISVDGTAVLGNGLQQVTLPLTGGTATFTARNLSAATSNITAVVPYSFDAGTLFTSNKATKTQRLVLGNPLTASASVQVQTTWQASPPTNTPTNTPVNTPTSTPVNTPVNTPTSTPANVPTNTPTITPGGPTLTPTNTPTNTPTITPGGPTLTPTITPGGPTLTPTSTPSGSTSTPIATPPNAPDITPTKTNTPGNKSTSTPADSSTATPGGSSTATPEGTATATPEGTPVGADGTPTGVDGTPTGADGTPTGANGAGGANQTGVLGQGQNSNIRPASLPRTGEGGSGLAQGVLLVAVALLLAGTLLRRGGARR